MSTRGTAVSRRTKVTEVRRMIDPTTATEG